MDRDTTAGRHQRQTASCAVIEATDWKRAIYEPAVPSGQRLKKGCVIGLADRLPEVTGREQTTANRVLDRFQRRQQYLSVREIILSGPVR